MSLDISKLRGLLAAATPGDDDRRRYALAEAAVNALPQLLAIAEAALAFRCEVERDGMSTSAVGRLFRVVDPNWKHDKPTLKQLDEVFMAACAMRDEERKSNCVGAFKMHYEDLFAAVDAARKEGM